MSRIRVGLVFGVWVFLLLVAVFGVMLNVPFVRGIETPRTWTVDNDGSADFSKIQDAINVASPDDIIYVYNGTYYESVVVRKYNLTLVGENPSTTIIDGGGPTTKDVDVVTVEANNVNIRGFTMQHSGYMQSRWTAGIHLNSATNCSITGNKIANNVWGITLECSWYNSLNGNDVTDNVYGISLESSIFNVISGNNVTKTNGGIELAGSYCNSIVGNNLTNNYFYGIELRAYSSYDSSYNTIFGNTVTNNTWSGIDISTSSNNNWISGNIIRNSTWGFNIFKASYNNISCNNVTNNNDEGVFLWNTSCNWFYHNNFVNNLGGQAFVLNSYDFWNYSYPSGGNYWSDYTGVDLLSGLSQNEPGSDGIGDTPYDIPSNNISVGDGCPLMNPWGFQLPIGLFAYSPEYPVIGRVLTFNANASYDRDGFISSYQWDFGDGNITTLTTPIITHFYEAEGAYQVNLTVTDNDGFSQSITKSLSVGIDFTPPTTLDDYNGLWHTNDFTITLTATDDISGVDEIYYKINDGLTETVSVYGQPYITTEGANNTLEYWSVDKAGNEESHHILTGIKLDNTYPTIKIPSRTPSGNVLPEQHVKVSVNVTDVLSGVQNVTLSYTTNDGASWTNLQMNYNLSTSLYEATIPGQAYGTWVRFKIIAYDYAGNKATLDGTAAYCVYRVIPEFPPALIPPILIALTLITITLTKKKLPKNQTTQPLNT